MKKFFIHTVTLVAVVSALLVFTLCRAESEPVPERKTFGQRSSQDSELCLFKGGKEEDQENPFLSWEEEEHYKKEKRIPVYHLHLSAVLGSKGTSYAVINGRILKEGDIIGNLRIIKINTEDVTLKDFLDKEYVLKLEKIISESLFTFPFRITVNDEEESEHDD